MKLRMLIVAAGVFALPAVAALLGISPREVVERHGAALYTVAFNGFAPGFSYLSAQAGLDVPRRRSPRVRVPAGSVRRSAPSTRSPA